MQATQVFGFEQVATEIIRGIMETVGGKPGLSPERKSAAQQTLVCTIMAFNPRDPVETTIAGQCMVYDHILRDGAHDLLRGQQEEVKIKNRASVLGSGKLFLQAMAALDRIQGRNAKSLAFAQSREAATAEPPAQPILDDDEAPPLAAHARAQPAEAAAPAQPPAEPPVPAAQSPIAPPAAPLPATPPTAPLNVAPPNAPRKREAMPHRPVAPAPPAATLVPRQQGLATSGPFRSLEALEEALLDGLTPEEKQSVRDGIARDKQEDAEQAARQA